MKPGSEQETGKANKPSAFDSIFEIYEWLEIVAAYLITGLIISMILYYSNPDQSRFSIGIALTSVALVLGIIAATTHWKKKQGNTSKK